MRGAAWADVAAQALGPGGDHAPSSEPPMEVSAPGRGWPLRVRGGGELEWEPGSRNRAATFDLQRGRIDEPGIRSPDCIRRDLLEPAAADPDEPPERGGWYHVVVGVNLAGRGPARLASLGEDRRPGCP